MDQIRGADRGAGDAAVLTWLLQAGVLVEHKLFQQLVHRQLQELALQIVVNLWVGGGKGYW